MEIYTIYNKSIQRALLESHTILVIICKREIKALKKGGKTTHKIKKLVYKHSKT